MAHVIPHDFNARQQALIPDATVFVAASAGSGKTKVLTDRLLRLLCEGIHPSAILCLTFTKAAALEMRERLMAALKTWAVLDEVNLYRVLQQLLGRPPQAEELTRARLLMTEVLDAPGGLQLMTIHSFCQQLLQRFPMEAGLSPGSRVIDDVEAQSALDTAMERALDEPLLESPLGILAERFSPAALREVITAAIASKTTSLDLSLDDFPSHRPDFRDGVEVASLEEVAQVLMQGSVSDQSLAQGIITFWSSPSEDSFSTYCDLFLTQKREIRARLASKKMLDASPAVQQVLTAEAERVQQLLGERQDFAAGQLSRALTALVKTVRTFYTDLKRAQNMLDYDDLIHLSLSLLRRADLADWVRYKLDRRLQHLLIDEAQDTSALQWELIGALAEEFYAGYADQSAAKSLFLVGDLKQSIYGFQGAAPELFKAMGQHYTRAAADAGKAANIIELTHSFRSSPAVLQVVDAVFAQPVLATHVECLPHQPVRQGHAGVVEIWPLIEAEHEWEASSKLARDLAKQISCWLKEDRMLAARGRPVTPGDILILVQRRQGFIGQLTRALKREGVPVAGPDRIELSHNIAIQDLIALGHFLVLPQDDVNLAQVLKSPLYGVTEEQLFELAHGRGERSLWDALKVRHHLEEAPWVDVYHDLTSLLARVDYDTPYQVFHRVIAARRQAFARRLGPEIHEILDEFLRAVQEDEGRHVPSLQMFLKEFSRTPQTLKREASARGAGEVRIMTVHGAKGLQAPVVMLADTTRVPQLMEAHIQTAAGEILWLPPSAEAGPRTQSLKDYLSTYNLPEYYRLLYVAMTRAEDELYVCGWRGGRSYSEHCWHSVITSALQKPDLQGVGHAENVGATSIRICHPHEAPLINEVQHLHHNETQVFFLPEFLVKADEAFLETGADTYASGGKSSLLTPSSERTRGALVHRALHLMTMTPQSQWQQVVAQVLTPLGDEASYWIQICAEIATDDRYALLFAANALSEVAVAGEINGVWVEGRIDRLVMFEDEMWIVDFKTDDIHESSAFSKSYREQLRRYATLLSATYPQKKCRTFLFWLKASQWTEITDEH